MNREEAKELLPIIQAFAEGGTVQYNDCGVWVNCADDSALLDTNIEPSRFRIKPESKYRPFKTQEECWNEMQKHPNFGWLKSKTTGKYALIGEVLERKDKEPYITWATNQYYDFSVSDIFDDYTFTDGTPFGVKEE